LTAFPEQLSNRYFEVPPKQVEQCRLDGCCRVNGDALVKGLLAAPFGVEGRELLKHRVNH
jgi:hypothetical protein